MRPPLLGTNSDGDSVGVEQTKFARRQYGGDLVNVVGSAENIVDMQVSYAWDEGRYKGLTTSFSVQNATDEPQKTYFNNNPNQAQYFKYFGTTIMWGMSYKM